MRLSRLEPVTGVLGGRLFITVVHTLSSTHEHVKDVSMFRIILQQQREPKQMEALNYLSKFTQIAQIYINWRSEQTQDRHTHIHTHTEICSLAVMAVMFFFV